MEQSGPSLTLKKKKLGRGFYPIHFLYGKMYGDFSARQSRTDADVAMMSKIDDVIKVNPNFTVLEANVPKMVQTTFT